MHASRRADNPGESVDHTLARLAARQHGVARVDQLRRIGLSPTMIHHRVRQGRLHRVHPRVYAVGHPRLSFLGRVHAALLSAGDGSFITGLAALHLRGIVRRPPATIEIAVRRHTRPMVGVRIIHAQRAQADELEHMEGIDVATAARALLDIASRTSVLRLNRLIYEGACHDLGVVVDIDRLLQRYPRRQGRRRLEAAVAAHRSGSAGARSAFEETVIARLREAGVPEPIINTEVDVPDGRIEVDLHWPEHRLVVEIDGVPHQREESKRRDRARARRLRAGGWALDRIRHDSVDRDVRRVVRCLTNARQSSI